MCLPFALANHEQHIEHYAVTVVVFHLVLSRGENIDGVSGGDVLTPIHGYNKIVLNP